MGLQAAVGKGVRTRAGVLAQRARGGDVDDARDELGHLEDVRAVSSERVSKQLLTLALHSLTHSLIDPITSLTHLSQPFHYKPTWLTHSLTHPLGSLTHLHAAATLRMIGSRRAASCAAIAAIRQSRTLTAHIAVDIALM